MDGKSTPCFFMVHGNPLGFGHGMGKICEVRQGDGDLYGINTHGTNELIYTRENMGGDPLEKYGWRPNFGSKKGMLDVNLVFFGGESRKETYHQTWMIMLIIGVLLF